MRKQLIRRNFIKHGLFAALGMLFFKNKVQAKTLHLGKGFGLEPPNETIQTIQDLHTTHGNFSNKDIPEDEIELIKKSCIRAANASNMQSYSIITVNDRKLMEELCGYRGSHMMLFCVDFNRLIACAESIGLSYYPDTITNFITASINTSLAVQTATIAARSLGIDSLLTNGIHRGDMERLWKRLKLPEKYYFPLIALLLGYADREAEYKVGRLDGKGIFHEKKYYTLTNDEISEIIGKYDDSSRHIALVPEWEDNGYNHYLEWFHKVWAQSNSNPAENETQLFVQLKKRGFVDLQGK